MLGIKAAARTYNISISLMIKSSISENDWKVVIFTEIGFGGIKYRYGLRNRRYSFA